MRRGQRQASRPISSILSFVSEKDRLQVVLAEKIRRQLCCPLRSSHLSEMWGTLSALLAPLFPAWTRGKKKGRQGLFPSIPSTFLPCVASSTFFRPAVSTRE